MAYVIGDDCIACGTCIDECPAGAISEGDKYSQSLRATSIQSTPMSAQSAAHALTFVRQRLSAFPKEYAEFYVVKNNKDCPQGSPYLFISHSSFLIPHFSFLI